MNGEDNDLPPGWARTTLGQIAETTLGKMLDSKKHTGEHLVPYLRNVNVQWGHIDTDDLLSVDIPPTDRDRFGVRSGDLLMCEGGEIGRCAVWRGSDDQYLAFQKALHRIRPYGDISTNYLRYLFEELSTRGELAAIGTGSTIKHLPQERLREISIALPPLAEQHRIVSVLEDHLSRLDVGFTAITHAGERAGRLTLRIFENQLQRAITSDTPLIELLAEPLTNGRSVPTRNNGFPVLRLTAVRSSKIDLTRRKGGAWGANEARPYLVEKDDFLIVRGNGSISLVGRGGLVESEPDAVAFPDTLIRARIDKSKILPAYIMLAWNSQQVRTQIESLAKTSAGIYKINQKNLNSIIVKLPHLEDQEKIIADAKILSSLANNGADAVYSAELRSAHLRRALLAQAFSGKLVPQDPNDEPASELLARIQAERAAVPKARRPRRAAAPKTTNAVPDGVQEELAL